MESIKFNTKLDIVEIEHDDVMKMLVASITFCNGVKMTKAFSYDNFLKLIYNSSRYLSQK